jgi:fatty acyl-CoA reductase
MLGNHDAVADIIPVDVPVNLMIAVSWFTAVKNRQKIVVYNCTSGKMKNTLTWGMLETFCRDIFFRNPFEKVFAVPNPYFTTNMFV